MPYTKRRRSGLAFACAALAATTLGASAASAEPTAGNLSRGSYTSSAGTLSYETYVPASYKQGSQMPLIVALHGCTQTADNFRTQTRFDDLAASKGFIVVYPEQSKANNNLTCWNWFQQADMQRGSGEPSLIAGITKTVQAKYGVDPNKVYVGGLSAGGAMAAVMGATYPDIYAAIGVGSGCEYSAGAPCAGYQSADPEQAGKSAHQAMGTNARVLPFIVFQGDQDTTVPPVNAQQAVRAGQVMADLADDGDENGSIPTGAAKVVNGQAPGGESYTVSFYNDGTGKELAQYWLVHGMGHAWSGGDASQQFSDPKGPDESLAMYDFFMDHPMGGGPSAGGGSSSGGSSTGGGKLPTAGGGTSTWPTVPGT
jgi:poly(hydroxyalkanoate) depolymerase family esterase